MKNPRKVVFPPQRLELNVSGNVVSLKFKKVDLDAHGYYVYRREGYSGKDVLLPKLLLSRDTVLTYTDTIKNISSAAIYTYSVATVNTSYEISPKSDGVTAIISGRIPFPSRVDARLMGSSALVLWNDVPNKAQLLDIFCIEERRMKTTVYMEKCSNLRSCLLSKIQTSTALW